MLTIRLARVGKKNKAQFKLMLQEKTAASGGRHVEILGSYDPHSKNTILKEERINYWLSKGAETSDTVHNLLVSKGVLKEEKREVKVSKKSKNKDTAEGADKKEEVADSADNAEKKEEVKEDNKPEEKTEEKKEEVKE